MHFNVTTSLATRLRVHPLKRARSMNTYERVNTFDRHVIDDDAELILEKKNREPTICFDWEIRSGTT